MEPISKHEQHVRSGEPLERKHPPARLSAERGEPRARDGKELSRRRVPFLAVVAVALSVLASGACGGTERGDASAADAKAGQESGAQGSTPTAKTTASAGSEDGGRDKAGARAGEAEAGTGGAQIAGNSRGDDGGEDEPREVSLKITGDRGTEFSGACSVGGAERALDGRVPERYVFEPRGKRLECELRTEGGGAFGIVLTDGAGVRSEQRTTAGESTVQFTYSNGGISSSTSSVSEGRSVTYSDDSSSEGSP